MNNNFCPSCGSKIEEAGMFCVNCGYNLNRYTNNANVMMPTQNNVPNKPSNGLAITGFVLGIISLCCCCYTNWIALVGLIFSIIGLNKAEKLNNNGKGLAIAGIVMNCISIVMAIAFLAKIAINLLTI